MYATPRPNGSWELRESRHTPQGPRARTLATFRVLGDAEVARAIERAAGDPTPEQVRAAARRSGAPVAAPPADAAASALLRELAAGRRPSVPLRRALAGALRGEPQDDAVTWLGASPERRGRALHDLLLLADRLPRRPRAGAPRFPRLASR